MNKDRNLRTLVVIAVVISIIGVSTAFAALTQTLNINGQAKIGGSQWRVEFVEDTITKNLVGKATELEDPTLSATLFTYSVSLKQPGDAVTYTFDVGNLGSIDAKVDAVPVLTGIPTELEGDITYEITYSDGGTINVGDILNVTDTRTIKLFLMYNSTAESVPSEEIVLTLSASIVYIQK